MQELIDYIKSQKISTSEICNACNNEEVILLNCYPQTESKYEVGKVKFISVFPPSNFSLHREIQKKLEEDIVLYIEPMDQTELALLDEIAAKYIESKNVYTVVVDGLITDVDKLKINIWAKGKTPKSLINKYLPTPRLLEIKENKRNMLIDGGILVADSNGVAIIPPKYCNEETLSKIQASQSRKTKLLKEIKEGKSPFSIFYQN